jgi:transposase-like protein
MGPMKLDESSVKHRRRFTDEFKDEAVQMLLDGQAAESVASRPGLSSPTLRHCFTAGSEIGSAERARWPARWNRART